MLHVLFVSLTWWQVGLLVIYLIYILFRARSIYAYGMKGSFIDYSEKAVKLYHVIWAVIDIPAILIGKFFPVLRAIGDINLYKFKEEEKKEDRAL
jgi:hypothetical protein